LWRYYSYSVYCCETVMRLSCTSGVDTQGFAFLCGGVINSIVTHFPPDLLLSSARPQNACLSLHLHIILTSKGECRRDEKNAKRGHSRQREVFLCGLLSLFVCCSCICPKKFSVRTLTNGSCSCDCFDRERECLRFKKGRESFSVTDTE
jgi:hypothetical protein